MYYCKVVELPWHLATANGSEGERGPPLIVSILGKIVIDSTIYKKHKQKMVR